MTRSFVTVLAMVSILWAAMLAPPPVLSQEVITGPYGLQLYYKSYYGPATLASLQIQREALYFQMRSDYESARIRRAIAHRLENDNQKLDLLNSIEKERIKEAERQRRIRKNIGLRDENKQKTWDRLKKNPEITSGEILTGKALNFLKDRLSTKLVSESSSVSSEINEELKLSSEMIHGLQVRQTLGRGEALIFRLDDGRPIQVDWWPPGLRVGDLKSELADFIKARNDVFKADSQEKFEADIKKLLIAREKLEVEFLSLKTPDERTKTQHSFHEYNDAKGFLVSLRNEIHRLHRVGLGQTASQDLSFKGDNLSDMLTHMIRNGLEFVPPKPGDEPVYKQVFEKLKNLCVTVEADEAETAAAKKD